MLYDIVLYCIGTSEQPRIRGMGRVAEAAWGGGVAVPTASHRRPFPPPHTTRLPIHNYQINSLSYPLNLLFRITYYYIQFHIPMRHAARTPPTPDVIACGFVAAGVASEIEKCHAELRGELWLLSVLRKFSASSLQVFCIEFFAIASVEFFEIAFVECFATSV